jgi:far upstream element-binding protein
LVWWQVIGRSGATIKGLMQNTGTNIQVDHGSNPNAPTKTINISGRADACSKAQDMINDIIKEAQQGPVCGGGQMGGGGPNGRVGSVSVPYNCPPDKIGLVIGRGGETIKRLQVETSAYIHVDRQTSQVRM